MNTPKTLTLSSDQNKRLEASEGDSLATPKRNEMGLEAIVSKRLLRNKEAPRAWRMASASRSSLVGGVAHGVRRP
jgi:hypothetical protein